MHATVTRIGGALLLFAAFAVSAHAHGGAYQPPPQPVPGRPGPTSGGGDDSGPITGKGPGAQPSQGTGGAPRPTDRPVGTGGGSLPASARRDGVGLSVVDFNSVEWARWWFANRMRLIDRRIRVGPDLTDVTPSSRDLRSDPLWRAEVQAVLHAALRDENRSIASAAAVALGKSGDVTEAAGLLVVLIDRDRPVTVREAAALGLGLLPTGAGVLRKGVRDALERVSADAVESERLRAMALYALGLRGDLASVPVILAAATGGGRTWDVPAAGVASLGLSRCELTMPDLLDLLEGPRRRKKREAVRRAYAAQALALMGDPASAPALRNAALGKEEHARRAATLALGTVATQDDDRSIDVLVHLLHRSRDDATRCMALLALGRVGGNRARDALRWAYLKGGSTLRPFGAIGLGLLARHRGFESVTGQLVDDLRRRKDPARLAPICIAVGLAGEGRAATALRDIIEDDRNAPLRAHAAFALGMVGDREKGARLLRDVLRNTNDANLRREAAMGLGLLRDREAVEILADLVREGGTTHEQGSAALALGRIGGASAADELVELATSNVVSDRARAMGVVGLGLLLDRDEGARLAEIGADLSWYLFTPTVLEILTIH